MKFEKRYRLKLKGILAEGLKEMSLPPEHFLQEMETGILKGKLDVDRVIQVFIATMVGAPVNANLWDFWNPEVAQGMLKQVLVEMGLKIIPEQVITTKYWCLVGKLRDVFVKGNAKERRALVEEIFWMVFASNLMEEDGECEWVADEEK